MGAEVTRPVRREPARATALAQLQWAFEMTQFDTEARQRREGVDDRGIDRHGTWWQNYFVASEAHWRALQLDQVGGPTYAHWLVWQETGDDNLLDEHYDMSRRAAEFLLSYDNGYGFPDKHQDPLEEIWGHSTGAPPRRRSTSPTTRRGSRAIPPVSAGTPATATRRWGLSRTAGGRSVGHAPTSPAGSAGATRARSQIACSMTPTSGRRPPGSFPSTSTGAATSGETRTSGGATRRTHCSSRITSATRRSDWRPPGARTERRRGRIPHEETGFSGRRRLAADFALFGRTCP